MRSAFEVRMRLVVDGLRAIPNVECPEPKGAFYLFPYFGAYYNDQVPDSIKMQSYLLETAGVSLVAGAPFGADGHLRLSFAASTDELRSGVTRITTALQKLT